MNAVHLDTNMEKVIDYNRDVTFSPDRVVRAEKKGAKVLVVIDDTPGCGTKLTEERAAREKTKLTHPRRET